MDADCLMWLLRPCTAVPTTHSPAPQPWSRAACDSHSASEAEARADREACVRTTTPLKSYPCCWGWGLRVRGLEGWGWHSPQPILTHNFLSCDLSLFSPQGSTYCPTQIPSFSSSNSASSVTNYLRNGVAIREQILDAPPSMELLDLRLSTSFPVRPWVLPRVQKGTVNSIKGSQPTSQLCGWWHTLNVLNECRNIGSVKMSVQEDMANLRPWSLQSAIPYNSLQRKKCN